MTPENFVNWLRGFLTACEESLEKEKVDLIKKQLENISYWNWTLSSFESKTFCTFPAEDDPWMNYIKNLKI